MTGLLAGVLAVAVGGCEQQPARDTPQGVWSRIRAACQQRDTGAVLELVDRRYADDLGGVGRLEDDLRQLFVVYGALELELAGARVDGAQLRGTARVRGRALRYRGPLELEFAAGPMGLLLRSGLLTDLRGVLATLRQRRLALERGAIERLDAVVSMEYRSADADAGRRAVLQRLAERLERERPPALLVHRVDIRVEADRARVTQRVSWLAGGSRPADARQDTERLTLRKEGTRWRILAGLG
jgi:hypothetical protein